jgi:putative transposase
MKPISYAHHRFQSDVIHQTGCLYFRFTLSFGDVDDLMAERGIGVSYETISRWARKFGSLFVRSLRITRPCPTSRWHLDGMVVRISSKRETTAGALKIVHEPAHNNTGLRPPPPAL